MLRCNLVLLLAAGLLVAAGCEGDVDDDRLAVTAAELDPQALVFALQGSTPWTRGLVDRFQVARRGASGVWVYGDGTVVTVGRDAADEGPCRDYRTWRLTQEELAWLLDLVRPTAWAAADGHSYQLCPAFDGGTTTLYVAAGDFTLRTSAYMGFDEDHCGGAGWEEHEPAPPAGLDALEDALWALESGGATAYEGEGLALAGCRLDPAHACGSAPPLDAAIVDGAAIAAACDLSPAWPTFALTGDAAATARALFAAPPATLEREDLPNAVVRDGDACVLLTCDEALPHDGLVDL